MNSEYHDGLSDELLSSSPVILDEDSYCVFDIGSYFHRVWKDTLPRCLCEGEIGEQDRFARGKDTGKEHFIQLVTTCNNLFKKIKKVSSHLLLHDKQAWQKSLIHRCGSQIGEPSGGGRRSCATKGGQGVWLPVHRVKHLWPLPSTHPSIISSTAAVQVNTCLLHNAV